MWISQDHPRSRGNDKLGSSLTSSNIGSLPLARERLTFISLSFILFRITPARAGTTTISLYHVPYSQDHPRSRGNDPLTRTITTSPLGSPPLARERRVLLIALPMTFRITPARAGTTFKFLFTKSTYQDHPRSRGNDINEPISLCHAPGSPPLARERRLSFLRYNSQDRITPARAGTTSINLAIGFISKDHPRSRGNDVFSFVKF